MLAFVDCEPRGQFPSGFGPIFEAHRGLGLSRYVTWRSYSVSADIGQDTTIIGAIAIDEIVAGAIARGGSHVMLASETIKTARLFLVPARGESDATENLSEARTCPKPAVSRTLNCS
jgi:hypothetical protein